MTLLLAFFCVVKWMAFFFAGNILLASMLWIHTYTIVYAAKRASAVAKMKDHSQRERIQ